MEQNEQLDYDVFERDWKKRHKASLPRKVSVSGFSTWFWIGFWLIVATGAAAFSAAHTIPAAALTLFKDSPYRNELASSVIVIVELVIFGAGYFRHTIWWMKWLLLIALLVALIANTSSSVRAVSENGGDMLNQVAGVLVSILAPFTALAAGEVLYMQLAHVAKKRQEANEVYLQQWKEVEAKINAAFTKAEKELKTAQTKEIERQLELERLEAQRLEAEKQASVRPLSVQTNTDKQPKHVAFEYLQNNPGTYTVRSLADAVGVSNDAAHKALKMFSENGNSNGHNEGSENGRNS